MPTEVQRNFKRQMKEIEKELKKKKNEGFYSYIEGDYINSYYETRRKKQRIVKAVSITGLLIFLWNFYAISTWINPIFYSLTGKNLPTVNLFDFKGRKQKEVVEYLQVINTEEERIKILLQYRALDFINAFINRPLSNEYYKEISEHALEIKNIISKVETMNPPDEMKTYHQITLKKFYVCGEIFDLIFQIAEEKNINTNKLIEKINTAIIDFNYFDLKSREELINVFNKIGMKYELSNGQIRYWW